MHHWSPTGLYMVPIKVVTMYLTRSVSVCVCVCARGHMVFSLSVPCPPHQKPKRILHPLFTTSFVQYSTNPLAYIRHNGRTRGCPAGEETSNASKNEKVLREDITYWGLWAVRRLKMIPSSFLLCVRGTHKKGKITWWYKKQRGKLWDGGKVMIYSWRTKINVK